MLHTSVKIQTCIQIHNYKLRHYDYSLSFQTTKIYRQMLILNWKDKNSAKTPATVTETMNVSDNDKSSGMIEDKLTKSKSKWFILYCSTDAGLQYN